MKVEDIIKLLREGESERVEFKTSVSADFGELICSFANTQGGYILVGVNDEGEIVGAKENEIEKISSFLLSIIPRPEVRIEKVYIDEKLVIVIKVEKSEKLHTVGGRVYVRIGSKKRPLELEEIAKKLVECLSIKFDELRSNYGAEILSEELFEEYLERRRVARGQELRGSVEDLMKKVKAVVEHEGKLFATNAGILFFTPEPKLYLPQAVVRVVVFKDESMREYYDSKEFSLPLWKLVDELENYLFKVLPRFGGRIIGFRRVDLVQYPIEAVREGVINALIHRNYFSSADVRIFIFPTKLRIINPGSFPPGVSPENPIHKPRNPLLSEYMYGIGYIERYGSGIERMKELCEKRGIKVNYTIQPFQTTLEFVLPKVSTFEIDERDVEILGFVRSGINTSKALAERLGVSKVSVVKRLKELERLGLVRRIGRGRKTRYKLAWES